MEFKLLGRLLCGWGAAISLCLWLTAIAGAAERPRIVVVKSRDVPFYNGAVTGFLGGLKARGLRPSDRVDVAVTAMSGKADADRNLMHEQVQKHPDMLVVLGTDATRLASEEVRATASGDSHACNVLFGLVLDPAELGISAGEGATAEFAGSTLMVSPGKQLEAFAQAAPGAKRLGVIHTAKDHTSLRLLQDARQEASKLGLEIVALPSSGNPRADLQSLAGKVDALWLIPDPASTGSGPLGATLDFAAGHRLPILGASSANVRSGALLAVSADIKDAGDVLAEFAARLLDHGPPRANEARVRGPRRLILSVNLNAAKRLGIKLPKELVQFADEVVDSAPQEGVE